MLKICSITHQHLIIEKLTITTRENQRILFIDKNELSK